MKNALRRARGVSGPNSLNALSHTGDSNGLRNLRNAQLGRENSSAFFAYHRFFGVHMAALYAYFMLHLVRLAELATTAFYTGITRHRDQLTYITPLLYMPKLTMRTMPAKSI